MANKFAVSVADVYVFDSCDSGAAVFTYNAGSAPTLAYGNALFTAKTLTDSSIDTTISNSDTRGGFGNQLLNVYYHSAEMTINFTDAKFNMLAVKALVGDADYDETTSGKNIITINADYVPKTLEVFLVVKIAGEASTGCTGIIGSMLIWIENAQLDGAVNISLTADGVATTPFKARALASESVYAKIYEFGIVTDTPTTLSFAVRA